MFKAAELVSCIIHVSSVTAVRIPKVAGSNLAIDQFFTVFLDTPKHVLIFNNKN